MTCGSCCAGGGPPETALGGHLGQPHAAIHPGERAPGRLRRANGSAGAKSIWRSNLGPSAGLAGYPGQEQDRAQVEQLAEEVQEVTGDAVEVAFVDQGYTGEQPAEAAAAHGIQLEVVKLPEAKKGFVLLPRRWVVERSFAWAARFRRLARDYERLPQPLQAFIFWPS